MRMLFIGPDERKAIALLRARVAVATPFDAAKLTVRSGTALAQHREEMRTFSIMLPVGFQVCYSHEMQPASPPPHRFQHISISTAPRTRTPAAPEIDMILEAFGMKPHREATASWVERLADGTRAFNCIQPG